LICWPRYTAICAQQSELHAYRVRRYTRGLSSFSSECPARRAPPQQTARHWSSHTCRRRGHCGCQPQLARRLRCWRQCRRMTAVTMDSTGAEPCRRFAACAELQTPGFLVCCCVAASKGSGRTPAATVMVFSIPSYVLLTHRQQYFRLILFLRRLAGGHSGWEAWTSCLIRAWTLLLPIARGIPPLLWPQVPCWQAWQTTDSSSERRNLCRNCRPHARQCSRRSERDGDLRIAFHMPDIAVSGFMRAAVMRLSEASHFGSTCRPCTPFYMALRRP